MTVNGWAMFPSGRWAKTKEAHGGTIALHAFISGAWAVTRGQASLRQGDPFVIGSRETGQPHGKDIDEAMLLAEAAAEKVADTEIPNTEPTNQTFDLFHQP